MIKRKKYWGNQLECSLAFKNNFNNCLTGLGLKGQKMRGDVAPGDLTHGDVAMKYTMHILAYIFVLIFLKNSFCNIYTWLCA